ncbi:protein FAR1-RELATED SEQUENCE 5-like [Lotus japonicus]|uniref:protein FAR1-RELATED SEQUENCE 5-like n=1 Tax=Lotus japonicus TaxID=34305 RepID=UPI00258279C3|nr:protein FAR1-RELATED SEQUENCE 5-like [Lotus japonicus]XP_057438587.1 protein FAR1-RELATED SEQUENCE 5-like [Lotus japonicus]
MAKLVEGDCVNLCDDEDINNVELNDISCEGVYGDKDKDGKTDNEGEGVKPIMMLTAEEIRDLEFSSEAEACDFYERYAKCSGFVSRKDDVYRDEDGNVVTRQLVCNRQGQRDQKHFKKIDRVRKAKPITRISCPARIRFRFDGTTLKWNVAFFEEKHNHDMTPLEHIHLIPSYCGLNDADKSQVDGMNLYGVRACNIMALMLGQKGGHESLGFTKTDLSNHIAKQKRERIQNGDAAAALSYLEGKADNDPMFFYKFTKTGDESLENLFWCDGVSRMDYNVFGDVIAFDSTYKKNKYNKPLVVFLHVKRG